MCADVMALPNALIYNGRLIAGSESVANAALALPAWPAAAAALEPWLRDALDPSRRVVWLDTDSCAPGALTLADSLWGCRLRCIIRNCAVLSPCMH